MLFCRVYVVASLLVAASVLAPQAAHAQAANLDMYWESSVVNGRKATPNCLGTTAAFLKDKKFSVRASPPSDPLRFIATSAELSIFVECTPSEGPGSDARLLVIVSGRDLAAAEKLVAEFFKEAVR
jgi:hypothetical protein